MSRVDLLRAELEAAELEEQLIAAKATAEGPSRELKLQLREARQKYREMRGAPEPGPGDAVAAPESIAVSAEVQ